VHDEARTACRATSSACEALRASTWPALDDVRRHRLSFSLAWSKRANSGCMAVQASATADTNPASRMCVLRAYENCTPIASCRFHCFVA